jgi:hypothetical protein
MVSLAALLLAAFGAGHRYSVSASAQAKQKWEYQIVKLDRIERITTGTFEVKGLSNLGDDGWEAVSINDSWILLKRNK